VPHEPLNALTLKVALFFPFLGIDTTPTFVINSHKKFVGLPDNFSGMSP
jgi:hypothetical protein